ncbi:MAG: hypothetical protein ACLQPD_14785 [Desulfomonilaceae bacterium]
MARDPEEEAREKIDQMLHVSRELFGRPGSTPRSTGMFANPHGLRTTLTARWYSFDYEELIQRDKVKLDIFWAKVESLGDSDNLPEPDEILHEIIEDLEGAMAQLRGISEDLTQEPSS